jgi:cellulase
MFRRGISLLFTLHFLWSDSAYSSQFTAEWHHTLAGATAGDSADPIDPSHKGPVITYMAKVTNATSLSVTGLKWFKIQQDGLNTADQSWGVDRMIANKGKVTFTIPSCIPAGQYLLRHEVIGTPPSNHSPAARLILTVS